MDRSRVAASGLRDGRKHFFPVVHCKRDQGAHAVAQTRLALSEGADGVFLICMTKEPTDVYHQLYAEVRDACPQAFIGLNFLGLTPAEAMAAVPHDCSAIWTDAGVDTAVDVSLEAMERERAATGWQGIHFGGFFHKGPSRPDFSSPDACSVIDEMAPAAAAVLDVPVVTGARTSQLIESHVLSRMRTALGDTMIATASGVDLDNIAEVLPSVDLFLVASSLEVFEDFDPSSAVHTQWLEEAFPDMAPDDAHQVGLKVPGGFDAKALAEMAKMIHSAEAVPAELSTSLDEGVG